MQLPHQQEVQTRNNARDSVGRRIRGAFEAAHGISENVRGNAMEAVDEMTGTRRGRVENEEVIRRGQAETRRGLENMGRGGRMMAHQRRPEMGNVESYERRSALTPTAPAAPQVRQSGGSRLNPNSTLTSTYPGHHRDDAIAGIPSPEARELRQEAEYQRQVDAREDMPFVRKSYN
ncbi:hypothetical protein CC2G_001655 [Coprinopsis cinerea AmutBmut pab1-1]|nr:hypothetical protein CC2G_001655 [Coprinopsis cinerea AmutBmut pab1-1]